MHRSVLTFGLITLFAAACDSPVAAPEAAAPNFARGTPKEGQPDHENIRTPFSRVVMNPCPNVPEPVAVEGYTHYNAHFKFFDGGNSSRLKSNSHGSGIGLVTGMQYQFHELHTTYGRYTYADSRWQTEQTIRFHVISQTNLDNFFSSLKMRVTYATTGITTEIISFETDCRG